ncbi:MAG: hypothetical protein A3G18_09410 [Rhodospirillales bacterium RIFCSPLOWO2_12_FULL_58_28]|nr:MAG: hypothetical protein A3H92_02260 [Rhodospirillales bacterium RIFCSPLOWO2_02_FULL_58_16]OHC76722.1 MAG: hypothetical protein A3G18_09410 [Rhodospirillales bacterium RIFCSPLOWO2_12_FULL_58_28]
MVLVWSIRSGRAHDLIELCPDLQHVKDRHSEVYLYNVFGKIEPWINDYFDFAKVDRIIPDYAMAYKNVVCKHFDWRFIFILTLAAALDKPELAGAKVKGLPPAMLQAMNVYAERSCFKDITPRTSLYHPAVNMLAAVAIAVYACAWIISRVRPFGFRHETFFFAADYLGDPRDVHLYREIADGGPILLVIRCLSGHPLEEETLNTYRTCNSKDGLLTIRDGIELSALAMRDTFRLFKHFRSMDPAVFFQIATLPHRRTMLRALFSRFTPEYFWGRDEYNVEHILRRQELNRIGKHSYGVCLGFGPYADLLAPFRYINYDRYYVFGKILQEIYKDTWAKDMAVVPSGTFGASRKDYMCMGDPRPNDIAVLAGLFTNSSIFVEIVRSLATAFPERTIWLQVKANYAGMKRGIDFVNACSCGLTNVVYTRDPIFDIFKRVTFAFSDPSTVVIEAMQFGLASFMLDISDIHEVCIFRNFPGICVKSAEEAIMRVKNLESGDWKYPRESYADLIDLSGRVFFDIVREDIGLPPEFKSVNNSI